MNYGFWGAVGVPPGSKLPPPPRNLAVFGFLQRQIEGNWPKGARNFHVLTPTNIRDWIQKRKGLSLEELRFVAAQEALEQAKARPKEQIMDWILPFLERNMEEAKRVFTESSASQFGRLPLHGSSCPHFSSGAPKTAMELRENSQDTSYEDQHGASAGFVNLIR